jgi:hypothetical protein
MPLPSYRQFLFINWLNTVHFSYSNRIASGSVTVRLIDCDSATVIWAKHVEDNFQTTSYYTAGSNVKTTYYTDGQLMQELIKRLGENIAEYFYPTK